MGSHRWYSSLACCCLKIEQPGARTAEITISSANGLGLEHMHVLGAKDLARNKICETGSL
jgi:hypothetical protein